MDHIEVEGKQQLAAALKAAACRDEYEARRNPFTVTLLGTRCKYNFPKGLTEQRLARYLRNLDNTPAIAFRNPEKKARQ